MKKTNLMLILMVFIASIMSVYAETKTQSFTISFALEDYQVETNNNGLTYITSLKERADYKATYAPALPLLTRTFAISSKDKVKSFSVTYKKVALRNRAVVMDINPQAVPVLENASTSATKKIASPSYFPKTYPDSLCEYVATSTYEIVSLLHFLISPFELDARNRKLYFITEMTITVELVDTTDGIKKIEKYGAISKKDLVPEYVRVIADNPQVIEDIFKREIVTRPLKKIDYVIITCDSLKSAFEPLINWKRTKGVYAEIRTIEEINELFSGKDMQAKIKACLSSLYKTNQLRYALLGGDDTIIPVRGCFGKVVGWDGIHNTEAILQLDPAIPADIYYACFNGNAEWDSNKNGTYGELNDNVNLEQNIYVTRLPVRTKQHIENYIHKILSYEKSPVFRNKILTGGCRYGDNCKSDDPFYRLDRTVSNAEAQGEHIYNKSIRPYWSGHRDRFYDTYTDFPGGADYQFSYTNLKDKLTKGYSFVYIATHGSQTEWRMEPDDNGASYPFSVAYANQIKNPAHTVIMTMSCFTNAFDCLGRGGMADPCLSESFIRSKDNGVIAYLGSSRFGFGGNGSALGASGTFDAIFFENLFSNKLSNKSFGALVAATKASLLAKSYTYDMAYRWLQFSINPIGDPETVIYTKAPKRFTNASIGMVSDSLVVDTQVAGCRVCVMSTEDNGKSFYKVYYGVDKIKVGKFPKKISVCITHPDYVPAVYNFQDECIQNTVVTTSRNYTCDVMRIGSKVNPEMTFGPVVFQRGTTTIHANEIRIECDVEMCSDATVEMYSPSNSSKQQ